MSVASNVDREDGWWDGPIVDAHHHFWEPAINPHPWLAPEARIPFRYGDYSAIKRRYLPDEYKQDAAGHDIVQTVYVETEWDPSDPIGETRYATSLAERFGWPNAIVAQAWLNRPDVAEVLASQAAFPLVRSVRHKPGGPSRPEEVGTARTLMSDRSWRDGFALLATHDLAFDLQTPWWNLDEAVDLARDFPGTTIILNHAGLPSQRDAESLDAWRAAMARFARCPNVVVKLSGMGVPGQRWTAESNGWIVRAALDLFGAERAMFGSNFPVDSLCASFGEILDGFKVIVSSMKRADQEAFFFGTARRVYRLA
ncbi:MAG: amidohydrolase [Acetobacteraceae bacterium]|nr:amidohydrolase [Acetobacteraceae bacterium]